MKDNNPTSAENQMLADMKIGWYRIHLVIVYFLVLLFLLHEKINSFLDKINKIIFYYFIKDYFVFLWIIIK